MHTEFWRRNFLENVQFEDREGDGRTALRSILERQVVTLGGGWKFLRTVSTGGGIRSVKPLVSATTELFRYSTYNTVYVMPRFRSG
jgi:hypothetical protein